MRWLRTLACGISLALAVGCSRQEVSPLPEPEGAPEMAKGPLDLPPMPPPPAEAPAASYARGGPAKRGPGPGGPADGQDVQRTRAETGVGVRGQRLEDERHVQLIVLPARTLFRTQQRLVFEVQVPQAMGLYEAEHGHRPKSHDEFMQKVIAANAIQLPELPAGQRYFYDPDTGELMVEKPAE